MKNMTSLILCFIFCVQLLGSEKSEKITEDIQSFVDFNLNVGMMVNGVRKHSKKVRLGTGRKTVVDQVKNNMKSYSANGKYFESSKVEYNVWGNVASGKTNDDFNLELKQAIAIYENCMTEYEKRTKSNKNAINRCANPESNPNLRFSNPTYYKEFYRKIRTTSFQLDIANSENNSKVVKINIQDDQNQIKEDLAHGYSLRYSNDYVNGNIKIGFKIPQNTWAYIVHRKQMSGVFIGADPSAFSEPGMVNSFNQNLRYAGVGKFLVWGRPGTEVFHQINFKNLSKGANLEGSLELAFEPISFEQYEKYGIEQLVSKISGFHDNYKSINSFDSMIDIVRPLLYLHGKDDLQNKLITTQSTEKILDLINNLNSISYSAEANPYHWDLKAASSILAHELSLILLKQVSPFCRDIDIQMPFTREKVRILGLKYASYIIERAKNRLEFNSFIHFETLLKNIKNYQIKGLTYSQVRSNLAEFNKIRDAASLLSGAVSMRESTYTSIYQELTYIYNEFGTISAPGSENSRIINFSRDLQTYIRIS